MTESKRETERKYEVPAADGTGWLPDLTGVAGIESVVDQGIEELDAVYYDTDDLRLAGASATLRRRTGGSDAGWHLKLPLTADSREEVRAPLSGTVPDALRDLALSRSRGAELKPVVRIRASRGVRRLVGADRTALAELSIDVVRAEPLHGDATPAAWIEMEVEVATDTDPGFLDAVERTLSESGVGRAPTPSKLARALRETGLKASRAPEEHAGTVVPGSAGDEVRRYVEAQVRALVDLDPAVRRERPDSVHRMRVTCRRLRSVLRSYRPVLDRAVTDPVREELKWLGSRLADARDQEVLLERFTSRIEALPPELLFGPVSARLRVWDVGSASDARRRTLDALGSDRYLALLDSLAALARRPPLRDTAAGDARKVMGRAILKEYGRLEGRVAHALELPPGPARDTALHQARKAAKKTRYVTESACEPLGRPAERFGKRVKNVQKVLGGHQDSVVARRALWKLASAAQSAGEPGFVWGLLYGREQAAADARERELPAAWAKASRPKLRKTFGS
ncbi:CYTH and CHAD domain-containing protein [Streptomyces sp. NPDC005423]|uniref:CYTH and CHAD domain-containing protein n=1 Tax=Streptomyces sp. NPDC005423 TaxID=3155343 RepID=UPI0033A7C218